MKSSLFPTLPLFLLSFYAVAHAQTEPLATPTPASATTTATLGTLVAPELPLTLTFGDLNATWRRISIDEANLSQSSTRVDAARDAVNQSLPVVGLMEQLLGAQDAIYWTQWQTVSANNDAFLVAYRARPLSEDAIERLFPANRVTPPTAAQFMATIPAWMRACPLDLALLNLKSVKIVDGAQPFDFNAQVARVRRWAKENLPVAAPKTMERTPPTRSSALREMALLIALYAQDNDDTLPPMKDVVAFKKSVAPWSKSDVRRRADLGFFGTNAILSGKKMAHISVPRDMIALYETQADANGARLVAFLDGSVRRLNAKDWLKYKRGSKIK